MVIIDNRKAKRWTEYLYSSGSRWFVVCNECGRVIADEYKYPKDTRIDYLPLIKDWAEMEVERHIRREHDEC